MAVTDFQKTIYNLHLSVSRSSQNKPFRFRKDFSDIENDKAFIYLDKLSSFFGRFPHINVQDFFKAPYKVYQSNDEYFDLKYYTTPAAIKTYTVYKEQQLDDIDGDDNIADIKRSLIFLHKFLIENNIKITEYFNVSKGEIPEFVLHLKERRINIYIFFGLHGFEKNLYIISKDILEFILGNLIKRIDEYRTKFYTSQRCRRIISEGINIINKKK